MVLHPFKQTARQHGRAAPPPRAALALTIDRPNQAKFVSAERYAPLTLKVYISQSGAQLDRETISENSQSQKRA